MPHVATAAGLWPRQARNCSAFDGDRRSRRAPMARPRWSRAPSASARSASTSPAAVRQALAKVWASSSILRRCSSLRMFLAKSAHSSARQMYSATSSILGPQETETAEARLYTCRAFKAPIQARRLTPQYGLPDQNIRDPTSSAGRRIGTAVRSPTSRDPRQLRSRPDLFNR